MGLDNFKHPSVNTLPTKLKAAVKIGWYEGSAFFAIVGLLNYKWSQTGLVDLADKSMAGILVSLLFGAGQHYFRTGDKTTGSVLGLIGILQAIGAKGASV
ncbi:hypothetical protein P280DRAFT_401405 [Massarina eburnea CBS 473.64]|uniref:Uncharacterized protein n=1 Tax=Massarina eburnea CBS 473.64 TaxID=1395130 RepID=A0A6A6RZQ6_9PLEO|nr:hypothetical protein P280DRAFT_401405 [Massarina eburnea CBS 473.64]